MWLVSSSSIPFQLNAFETSSGLSGLLWSSFLPSFLNLSKSFAFLSQVDRWARQYYASTADGNPGIDGNILTLIDWLKAHIPAEDALTVRTGIVHGDFRMDNVILHPTEVTDWSRRIHLFWVLVYCSSWEATSLSLRRDGFSIRFTRPWDSTTTVEICSTEDVHSFYLN